MSQIIQFPVSDKPTHPWVRTRDRVFAMIWNALRKKNYHCDRDLRSQVAKIATRLAYELCGIGNWQLDDLRNVYLREMESLMAALDGRPVQTKAAFTAEQSALKAARKGDTNDRTRQKIKRVAKGAQPVTDAIVDTIVEQAKEHGANPAKVRSWCEEMRRKYPDSSIKRFYEMLNEDRNNLR